MVAVLALVAAARLRLLNFPLERDEGEYAYAGQLLLQGIPPYQLACNMKFPGMYAVYALIMALFGQTPAGIHFGVLCVTTLTAWMLFRLGGQILDLTAGVVAATTYAVLAASPAMLGLAGHATHFAAFFAAAGLWVMWQARQNPRWPAAGGAGLLFGLAILMKQPAALIGLWALAAFAIACLRQSGAPAGRRLRALAAFCAGLALPFGLSCLILWQAGVFGKFWFWTVTYAREYASVVPLADAPGLFWKSFHRIITTGFLPWLFAAAGLGLVWRDVRMRGARVWLLGFSLASALAICPDFYFRKHYFLLTLPAAALLAGCAVSGMCRLGGRNAVASRFGGWPVWGYAVMLAATIALNSNVWFAWTPVQIARATYGPDPLPEAQLMAMFIRANSAPDARVAVLGSEPEIYFLARRRSATGYLYTYGLMEPQPFARQMQDEMIREIETNAPEFVVYADNILSWARRPDSDPAIFKWWMSYQTNYTLVGVADVISPAETQFAWGAEEAARYGPVRVNGLELYQRKTAARGL